MKIFQNTANKYHSLSMSKYSDLYQEIDKMYSDVTFSYKGSFDTENLAFINSYIEKAIPANPGTRTDLFKIFLEMALNIAQNSLDIKRIDGELIGCGMMLIHEFEDKFSIISGNPGKSENIKKLISKCNYINSLEQDGIRQYKRELMKLPAGIKGNGNIGLIKISMITGHKLEIKELPINDNESFAIMNISLHKTLNP